MVLIHSRMEYKCTRVYVTMLTPIKHQWCTVRCFDNLCVALYIDIVDVLYISFTYPFYILVPLLVRPQEQRRCPLVKGNALGGRRAGRGCAPWYQDAGCCHARTMWVMPPRIWQDRSLDGSHLLDRGCIFIIICWDQFRCCLFTKHLCRFYILKLCLAIVIRLWMIKAGILSII